MFVCKNYVPVLKWKEGEKGALKELSQETKHKITPLIQLVMPNIKNEWRKEEIYEKQIEKFRENIKNIPQDIINYWGNDVLFLDFMLLYSEIKDKDVLKILGELKKYNIKFIPVFHLSDKQDFIEKIVNHGRRNNSGFCLKLTCGNFNESEGINALNKKISNLLSEYDLQEKEIDLIVDIQEKANNKEECDKYYNLGDKITNLEKFRFYIFSGGSFPPDLSNYSFEDSPHDIERKEWKKWKEYTNKNLKRMPVFSDYTIQHPIYKEKMQFYQSSASLKYTLKDSWMILRGQKGKFGQYLANAQLLSQDKVFLGQNYSYGDKYIHEKAEYFPVYSEKERQGLNPSGTGNAKTWIKALINHHLTLTADQIANYLYKK